MKTMMVRTILMILQRYDENTNDDGKVDDEDNDGVDNTNDITAV